jgi:hypothetical protein
MAENRTPPDEAVVVVDVEKVLALREQTDNEGHFFAVLRRCGFAGSNLDIRATESQRLRVAPACSIRPSAAMA